MELNPKLTELLENYKQVSQTILTGLTEKIKVSEDPKEIFHYTNNDGLRGILESGNLRLTSIFNLNDPSEIRHGFSNAIYILKKMAETGSIAQQYFADRFERIYEENIERTGHFFVTSCSMSKDELGQWRAYADDGRGYVLEFDVDILNSLFDEVHKTAPGSHGMFQMRYEEDEIKALHMAFVTNMFHLIDEAIEEVHPKDQFEKFATHLSVQLAMNILEASLYFKHKAYQMESEYRYLQMFDVLKDPPSVQFRQRKNELIKYRTFKWWDGERIALKRVILGPALDYERGKRFVRECLNAFKIPIVPIDKSEIPYRSHKDF